MPQLFVVLFELSTRCLHIHKLFEGMVVQVF